MNPNKFPRARKAGPHCELAMWVAKYDHSDEYDHHVNQWTLKRLYNTPLFGPGSSDGLLRMIHDRLGHATATKNSDNKQMLLPAYRKAQRDAIDDYDKDSSSPYRSETMATLLLKRIAHNTSTHPNTQSLQTMMTHLKDHGLYFPPNHYNRDPQHAQHIDQLLPGGENAPLWTMLFPYPSITKPTPFGDLTFEQVFSTPLMALQDSAFAATYTAVKNTKKSGILRAQTDFGPRPDGQIIVGASVAGNSRCCNPQTHQCCQIDGMLGLYCGPVSGTDPSCNSMSDECTGPCTGP